MRQLYIFILLGLIFSCVHDKETKDGCILTLQFGKYYNWVYWEMKQMNFKIQDNELLIDTTYELKLQDFKPHHVENLEDYPEIAKFLKKPIKELYEIQNTMRKISCENRRQFWIQYDDETKPNLIKFRGTIECDLTQQGTLSSVYQEMDKLKTKYKP